MIYEREEINEYDRNVVSLVFDDCISKIVVEYLPFNWSKLAAKFVSSHPIRFIVAGNRVSRGAGFDLEIPVVYISWGDARVTNWFKKALEKLDSSLNVKVEKCV